MNLLFVSNLYPPHHISGYEMLCHEAASHLEARGHRVSVLTSTYGGTGELDEPGVYRKLRLESDIYYYRPVEVGRYWLKRRSNLTAVKSAIAGLEPDVVVIWGMWNLSRLVAAWSERLAGSRVVYYLADVWPAEPSAHEAYWNRPETSLAGRAFKRILSAPVRLALRSEWRPYRLRFEHTVASCQFTRDELLRAGLPVERCKVIYEGIDPAPYYQAAQTHERISGNGTLRTVFVGSLTPHKGAHTAIEALGHLKEGRADRPVHLTVLGAGHPQYERYLHQMVERWQLAGRVSFQQPIPRSQLPDFLAQFDALVMSSVYEEPLARISQEALAAGLVLVATLTGGTGELLADNRNGLAFGPEDAEGLARQLGRLIEEPGLQPRLTAAGRQTVAQRFTISRMIDELEAYLAEIAG